MIRVVLVTTELRPGGAERCLTNLAVGLDRKQFQPHVFSLAPPPQEQTGLIDQLAAHDVPVSFVGVQRNWQFFAAVRRLRRMLMEHQPHVVQTFLFHANVVSAVATRNMRVPVLAGLRVAQRERMRQFVERRLQRRFAGYVCVSQAVADLAINEGGLPSEKVHVIHNGVDISRLAKADAIDWTSCGIASGRRVILFAGRLDHQKGVDVLLQAARELLLGALPQHDLAIVGDGKERDEVRRLLPKGRLRRRCHLLGWRGDVASLLKGADLFVLPSRYEGLPNILLEAMATGLPVVATDVEGVREVVGPLSAAQLVPPYCHQALADRVIELAKNREFSTLIGAENQARVASQFSLEAMVASYADLFARLSRPHHTPCQ